MSFIKCLIVGSVLPTAITGTIFIKEMSSEQILRTAKREGFTSKPIIPVKGDVPTIGYGTTIYPNGTRVTMLDKEISKKQAFEYLKEHIVKDSKVFNQSILNIPISQEEYDIYMDFTYQYGIGAWLKSSMLVNLKAKEYIKSCAALLKYKYVSGYDCSTPNNRRCPGVWTEQIKRYERCIEANNV